MAEALLAFGGNIGDPTATIERAYAALDRAGVAIVARSSFYRTPPWGPVPQPDFVNSCVIARTELTPADLLKSAKTSEASLGRLPGERWGPRAIDIDIIDYDGITLAEPGLTLPHPHLTERAFVLVPLGEIAPDRVVAGRTVREWLAEVDASEIRLCGPARRRGE